jgi:hypothetical protein
MIIDRRAFIQRSVLFAAAPSIAGLLSVSLIAKSPAASLPHLAPPVAGNINVSGAVLKIEGWEQHSDPSGGHALIRINQAWTAAWR